MQARRNHRILKEEMDHAHTLRIDSARSASEETASESKGSEDLADYYAGKAVREKIQGFESI